jgi:outer membrane protein OmpA-like peptidoglycan-associated protein
MTKRNSRGIVAAGLFAALALSACTAPSTAQKPGPAPTAAFVFFKGEALLEGSDVILAEAARHLSRDAALVADVVGHVAPDEPMSGRADRRIDARRAGLVADRLAGLGVDPERVRKSGAGRSGSIADRAGSADVDRRVDIVFGVR